MRLWDADPEQAVRLLRDGDGLLSRCPHQPKWKDESALLRAGLALAAFRAGDGGRGRALLGEAAAVLKELDGVAPRDLERRLKEISRKLR
jgi:hypothetical protein